MRCSSPRAPDAVCSRKAVELLCQIPFCVVLLLIALSSSGCAPASGTSAITPVNAAVDAGGSVQFSVRNGNPTVQVTKWLACGIAGGSSTCGTISPTGLYQAPKTVNQSQTFEITAVTAEGVQFGAVYVQVKGLGIQSTGLFISPSSVALVSEQTRQFSITSAGIPNTNVRWTARLGSITSSGVYTAPIVSAQSQDTVTAVSLADGSKSISASVTVTPQSTQVVSVSVSPNSTTVGSGQTTQFSAVVSGTTNTAVTWSANLGSISSSGFYTAPSMATQSQDTVTAVSVADASEFGNASIVITPALQDVQNYWVGPGGSDSNDGSQSSPWATIQHADAALTPGANGTVVHVAPGTYDMSKTGFLKTSRNGTASARISFVSDTLYGAQIVGGFWQIDNTYADVNGFQITCPYCWSGINVGESNPPYTGGSDDHILNNYIHDIGTLVNTPNGIGCPGGGGIFSANNSTQVVIDSNLINNIGSKHPCLETHGIYVAGPGVTVTNNVISNAVSWGIQFFGNVCHEVAANNTVFHNYQGGIIVSAGWTNTGICNNGSTPYNDYTAVDNNLSINNGIDGYGAYGIEEFGPGRIGSHNTYNNNLTLGNLPDDSIHIIGGGSSSANVSSGTTSSIFVNYQDDGSGNYHLQNGSAALDVGTNGKCASSPGLSPCEPSADFDAAPRPQATAFSIGAFISETQ